MIFTIFKKKERQAAEQDATHNIEKKTWFHRLRERLGLSSLIFHKIFNIFSFSGDINYDEFEALLLETDMGYDLVRMLIERVKNLSKTQIVTQKDVKHLMKSFMIEVL